MRLVQVALHADDLDRAAAFYSDLLRAPPRRRFDPPGLLFFDLDGVRLLLEQGAPSAMIYLAVDDLHASVERVRASGVAILAEPHAIFTHEDDALGPAGTEEWMAFITDSEGNTVGLVSQLPRPAPG